MNQPSSWLEKRQLIKEMLDLKIDRNALQRLAYSYGIERGDMEELRITKVDNGWIVKAGCMTFVFNKPEELISEFTRYVVNPSALREEYLKKYNSGDNIVGRDAGGAEVGEEVPRNYTSALNSKQEDARFMRGDVTRRT